MTHYTITLNRPEGQLRGRFPALSLKRCYDTEQFVVWDGPARKQDVLQLYEALSPYAAGAGVFAGRDRGKCIVSSGKWD